MAVDISVYRLYNMFERRSFSFITKWLMTNEMRYLEEKGTK
jgi:hypothetical protein